MDERWLIRGSESVLRGEDAESTISERLMRGERTTWLDSTKGRTIGFVSNEARAMVVLMEAEGDPGFHAIDPESGTTTQAGYVLDNGQDDTYADHDTVPLSRGLQAVAYLVLNGELDPELAWQNDRLRA